MEEAIKEAKKSLKTHDVPIGTIIVENGIIIAKAHNIKEKTGISTKHAELIAIEKACKKKKTWHLDNCIMYITMEPCMMCIGAIIESRIMKIVYAVSNNKYKNIEKNKKQRLQINKSKILDIKYELEVQQLLQNFFEERRK